MHVHPSEYLREEHHRESERYGERVGQRLQSVPLVAPDADCRGETLSDRRLVDDEVRTGEEGADGGSHDERPQTAVDQKESPECVPAQQVAQFRLELVGDGLEHEGDKQQDPDPVGTAETGAVKQWERGEERSAERYERGESELPFPSCRIDDQLPLFLILGDEYQGVATLYEHQEDEKSAKQGNDGPPVVL